VYVIGRPELDEIRKVFASGNLFRYTRGRTAPWTQRLEKALAAKFGVKHALAVSSGTGALICALAGLKIGPGDEVIVPGYTFISSALAPLAVGAVPVICEVDETLTMDPRDVERRITRHTKAIVPVYMLGLPCNMRAILRLGRKHNVAVVEDAAQAAGGSYRGKRFGSMGAAGILSFNHYKIISCGEGGAVLTNSAELHQRAMIFHDGGCVFFDKEAAAKQPPFFAGLNFRTSEIQSAIMGVQLRRLDGILRRLRARKRAMMEPLWAAKRFRPSRCNEAEGDCATTLPLLLRSGEDAAAFVADNRETCGMFRPIDTDRHVYVNWEPILKHLSHHPKLNPWKMAARKLRQTAGDCPATLDVLQRTVCLHVPYDRTIRQARSIARRLCRWRTS
jgi:dTDP-4-amino-4,6-dideoxygalactose transaminase